MPNLQQLDGYEGAVEAKLANTTPRAFELDRLDRFVDTTQYDGKPNWFSSDKPLWDRKPCIAYPLTRAAIDSNVDLTLGEGRAPTICVVESDEDDTDEEQSLDGDEGRNLNKLIADIIDQARCRRAWRIGFGKAQGSRSVALICGVRPRGGSNKLFVDIEPSKWCTPKFDKVDSTKVIELEIRYPYIETYRDDRDGKQKARARIYRRVIDEKSDTTFKPADASKHGIEPRWVADPDLTVEHGLGRCPVVWYAHMAGCTTVARIDGRAIHEHLLDEIEALDFALSQRHRAALFAGDPQWVEIGVGDEDGPAATGEEPLWSSANGGELSDDNPRYGHYTSLTGGRRPRRKKGPGEVWKYDNPDAKVSLETLPGDALKAISDHAADLRTKIAEGLGVVFSDPEMVRFASAMSGKAQELLKSRQLDRCDQYRDDMADGMIRPTVYLLLWIAYVHRNALRLQSLNKVADQLGAMFENDDLPELELRWGPYFKLDSSDEKAVADALASIDKVIGITDRMKLRKLRSILGIDNIDAALEEIEEERERRVLEAQERMKSEASAFHSQAMSENGAIGTRDRSSAGEGSEENSRDGSGSSAADASED